MGFSGPETGLWLLAISMTSLLEKLPATIVLGVLATVFLVTCRKHSSARVRLWMWGWGFILAHFAIRLLAEVGGIPLALSAGLDLTLLGFSGIAFAISVSPVAEVPHERKKLSLLLGTPIAILSFVLATGGGLVWLSAVAFAVMYFGSIALFVRFGWRSSTKVWALYSGLAVSAVWSIWQGQRGNLEGAVELALLWLFLLAAILVARVYSRPTCAVVVTTLGFAGWASVWGIAVFLPSVVDRMGQFSEFWNVPKYILAFGMILLLLEDEKYTVEAARSREIALNQQMESFAEVTSRLLAGESVATLCDHIAKMVTEVTTFSRIVITLADEQQKLHVAGSSGIPAQDLAKISKTVVRINPEQIAALEPQARKISRSFICSRKQMEQFGTVPGVNNYEDNEHWQTGDELLVPIRSQRGASVGFFVLDEPRDVKRVTIPEISKLELLANDLGVAIDRAYLQRELVRSEKLAGMGQLVAGVAHELNNPLTAVLGYAEMMIETAPDAEVRNQVSVIQRESLRMKRIIENLVRFAKRDRAESRLLSVNSALQEAVKIWTYQARSRGVQLEVEIEKDLPMIRFDENQLKQVFLNLTGNAFEAVEGSEEPRVAVACKQYNGYVTLSVCDSGEGFADPDRVFDPFFNTKGVGKGPGLGLSVCYGIVKQHGGEIRACNVSPRGGCILVELPAVQQELALVAGE